MGVIDAFQRWVLGDQLVVDCRRRMCVVWATADAGAARCEAE